MRAYQYLIAAACCALLTGCGGDSASGSTSRQQTNPAPAPAVSALHTHIAPPGTVEAPPATNKVPAHLKPPRL